MNFADLNPVTFFGNLGFKAGAAVGSSLFGGQPPAKSLAEVFSKPASPVVINQAPKTGLDALGIGFVEKNLLIIGAVALGAAYILSKRVTINSADFARMK